VLFSPKPDAGRCDRASVERDRRLEHRDRGSPNWRDPGKI